MLGRAGGSPSRAGRFPEAPGGTRGEPGPPTGSPHSGICGKETGQRFFSAGSPAETMAPAGPVPGQTRRPTHRDLAGCTGPCPAAPCGPRHSAYSPWSGLPRGTGNAPGPGASAGPWSPWGQGVLGLKSLLQPSWNCLITPRGWAGNNQQGSWGKEASAGQQLCVQLFSMPAVNS